MTIDGETQVVIGHFDGLCEPNPGGHACCGWSVLHPRAKNAMAGGYHAGKGDDWTDAAARILVGTGAVTTNNIAEYLAAIECLRQIYKLPWRGPVILRGDSTLVVEQYKGVWACKDEKLRKLLRYLRTAAGHFESVALEWVPREQNEAADAQARLAYRVAAGRWPPERNRNRHSPGMDAGQRRMPWDT